jgi:SAM-dependent methyltransferase
MNYFLEVLDRLFLRYAGFSYLRLTRDTLIHERCRYLIRSVRAVGRRGLRILDVGCGSGMALYYLDRFCGDIIHDYVGIDLNVDRLHKRYRFVSLPHVFYQVDLDNAWDFGKFDIVWCSEVIEHLIEDERLFRRMAYHLDAYGLLVVTTPSRDFVRTMGRAFPSFDHVSPIQNGDHVRIGYELGDFERMARQNDLCVVSHAWVSPRSKADIAVRLKERSLQRIHVLLADLKRGQSSFVINGEAGQYAAEYWSLAVSLTKEAKPTEPRLLGRIVQIARTQKADATETSD